MPITNWKKSEKSGCLIFDSYALIAYLRGEEQAWLIKEILENRLMKSAAPIFLNLISLGEILYILKRGGFAFEKVLDNIRQLPITIYPIDESLVIEAANIKSSHKLSYADAFVAATAIREKATIITGDPEFKAVGKKIKILWLR